MKKLLLAALTAALLSTSARASAAQITQPDDGGRPQLTRGELQDLLGHLEAIAGSVTSSSESRARAHDQAMIVRSRLDFGDLRVGDQVALVVEGEDSLSRTFVVGEGQTVTLPQIGDISLHGVLRSELEGHMTQALSKYLRNPVVRADALVRITISGRVQRPGYYGVSAERLLSDAIMEAGGPAPDGDLNSIYVERAGQRIWSGPDLQQAITEGRTLDQLSLQTGDQLVVSQKKPAIGSRMMNIWVAVVSSAALLVTVLTQM